jgi:hypothetical protein
MGIAQQMFDFWQHASWLAILGSSAVTCISLLACYRLFFHPLSRIPGPRLAALTTWWEVYENVWRGGHLPFELKELHKIYGLFIEFKIQISGLADTFESRTHH